MWELFNVNFLYKDFFYIWFDVGIVFGVSFNVGLIICELVSNLLCDECLIFVGN